jgi:hypothetical protein
MKLGSLIERIADVLIGAALWLLDKFAGPYPETEADKIREARCERLRKAFPGLSPGDRKRRPSNPC